ncbi:hypothetical protein HDU91_005817 [Kappamyces sp. JEL0680]|nr:hypothetical protein HDU91_005817 [Kappamyces sp. JEL0680]
MSQTAPTIQSKLFWDSLSATTQLESDAANRLSMVGVLLYIERAGTSRESLENLLLALQLLESRFPIKQKDFEDYLLLLVDLRTLSKYAPAVQSTPDITQNPLDGVSPLIRAAATKKKPARRSTAASASGAKPGRRDQFQPDADYNYRPSPTPAGQHKTAGKAHVSFKEGVRIPISAVPKEPAIDLTLRRHALKAYGNRSASPVKTARAMPPWASQKRSMPQHSVFSRSSLSFVPSTLPWSFQGETNNGGI